MHWLKRPAVLEDLDSQTLIYWNSEGVPELKYYLDEAKGVYVSDFWDDIDVINSMADEYQNYMTQKPEMLLERILKASSNGDDLVADFFCGSGTTLAVAEKLGRRWIGCDLGRWGTHVTRKRMLGIENCKPFEVLNLGRYERQYWQGVTFAGPKGKPLAEQALYEYLAFILKLYGAQPLAGLAHLHGKKGKALVHIGAVDAPVTIAEIDAAVVECAKLGFYHPDWVVVQKTKTGEVNWIIETKGRVWEGTGAKDEAIRDWCERIAEATGTAWRYVRVNQVEFDSGKPTAIADL